MTGARQALAAKVRKGTVFTSPKVTSDYLEIHAPVAGQPIRPWIGVRSVATAN